MPDNAIKTRERLLDNIRASNNLYKVVHCAKDRKKGYGDGYLDGFHHATMLILAYLGREDLMLDIYGEIPTREEPNDL